MFELDVRTLLVVLAINSLMAAIALPTIMGRRISRAARWAQLAVGLQAITWIGLLMSGLWLGLWQDHLLSSIAITSLSTSWLAMFLALDAWLGPRHGMALMKALTLLTPLGYTIGFSDYAFRVGWANLLLAAQMALVCVAALRPVRPASRHWRMLLLICCGGLCLVTAWRGVLGAFFTTLYPTFMTPHRANLAFAIGGNVALVLSTVAILVAWREEAERLLQSQAQTDGLTGVMNRRAWTEAAAALLSDAERFRRPLVVMMLDIDHFKRINDEHGHETGDRALQWLAEQLRQNVRAGDLVGRYGGEEFCLLLNRATAENAHALDRRLRDALAESAHGALGLHLDFSAGLAERPGGPAKLDHLLRQADAALYHAKRTGRGRLARPPQAPDTLAALSAT